MYKVVTIIAKIFLEGFSNPGKNRLVTKVQSKEKVSFQIYLSNGKRKALLKLAEVPIVMVIHLFTLLDHDP